MQSIGNDYICIDCFQQPTPDSPENLAIQISQRRVSIGSDGIMLIMPSNTATCKIRVFNAKGIEILMCSNAIRCVGKYVYENGITSKNEITVETASDIINVTLHTSQNISKNGRHTVDNITVNMGKAIFSTNAIKEKCKTDVFIGQSVKINNTTYHNATAVSLWCSHLVIFHKDIKNIDLSRLGKQFDSLQNSLPDKIDIEFAEVIAQNTIQMRVWERGVGESLTCSIGACAVAAAFSELAFVDRSQPITVQLSDGDLFISYLEDKTVLVKGSAKEVFRGSIEL